MSKCLVTGCAGFIGSHLTEELLRQGHAVLGIDNLSTGSLNNMATFAKHSRFSFIPLNLSQHYTTLLEDIEYVFHLAAQAAIVPSIERPAEYFDSNVTGTLHVLEAARTCPRLKRFIYAASSSCYGLAGSGPELSPQYPYALTKMLGEQLVLHWKKVYGIPAVSLRLFNVYGSRAAAKTGYGAMFGTFLAQNYSGKPLTVVGNGKQRRDFVYVTDVVAAFISAMNAPAQLDHVDIGTGETPTILDIATLISSSIVHIPERPGEPQQTRASTREAVVHLGWCSKVSIREGVSLMLSRIDEWKHAPVWTPQSIETATAAWFRQLS